MPDAQLPAVRPPRPPYIEAFENFTSEKQDRIEAFVAYGLFISSDYAWASKQLPSWPSAEQIEQAYSRLLCDSDIFTSAAKKIVDDHRENLVREHEKKYLDGVFEQSVLSIVRKSSHRHFGQEVLAALCGAIIWSFILMLIPIIAHRNGIDVLEAYQKASGLQVEHSNK